MYRYLIPSLSFLLAVALYCYTWRLMRDSDVWHYHTYQHSGMTVPCRTHELTDETQRLSLSKGWETIGSR